MISVVYCTRETNPKHREHILKSSGLSKYIEVIEIVNRGEGLTKAYNRGLAQAKNDIVVFMHDDVTFESNGWGNKLIKHFETTDFGILGLAGTTDIPDSGRWWEDRTKMVGIVNHESEGKKWESKYSKSWNNKINEVVVVDGLFFAVHKHRIKNNFDENFAGFHFYELDFILSNYLQKVRVGVIYNIRVTHKSIGKTNDEWENNRIQFAEKFKVNLPIKFVPDYYQPKETSIKTKVPIKVIVQSSGDVITFEKLYNNLRSFNYPKLEFYLITNDSTYDNFKELTYEGVTIFEGNYNTLPKNLSVLKFEDNFLTKDDELVLFINDTAEVINDIFSNFVKLYSINKNTFGCAFPLSYKDDRTIFSSSLTIFADKDNKVGIQMRDVGTYYNLCYGVIVNPLGNLSDCFVTTANNLKALDWFKVNFESPLYFNEFSLRLHLKNKITYNDTNSLAVEKSFSGTLNIQEDFQNFINAIASEPKLQELVKKLA